jgi:hypothetical protein
MINYIKGMIDELPNDMSIEVTIPASSHIFQVNEDAEKLDENGGQLFHHTVAKLLCLCKQAHPDIQTMVSFLCTRVKAPDIDNYKKLT